jgi:hypothetical protein
MARTVKGQSQGMDWIMAHLNEPDGPCLIWPFCRSRGSAVLGMRGLPTTKAPRIMCELVNGPPPTPKHEAAHSCGCGHLGCMHPKHLSWKTRAENQQDRRKHGTHGRGPNMNARRIVYKLNPQKVAEIRAIGDSMSKEELGRRYGVTPSNIAKILRRESWPSGDYSPRGFAVTPRRRVTQALGELTLHRKEG